MDCPCNQCNGIFKDYNSYVQQDEIVKEKPRSVWERLVKVSEKLDNERYGVPSRLINELNDICDTIESIDSGLLRLQKYDRGSGNLEFEIGKLSQKLY